MTEKERLKQAEGLIEQIENRFPNWKSYRDLVDCIDCTLYDLRSDSHHYYFFGQKG